MADLGKAYVQIIPSAEGISGKITEILDPESKRAGTSAGQQLGSNLGSTIKKTIAVLGVGKMVSDSITNGADFESSMAKASTLFSGTADEFSALQSRIMDISSATGVAASQLAEAAYSAESASVPMGNLGDMIEASSKLATAGFTDIDTALSATAKTMNAYGMMSDDVAETQANMEKVQRILIQTQNKGITTVGELGASLAQVTPTAAAAGVGFDQVGAALSQMTAQGTPTAQATTQLRSAIAELSKSGTTASTALEEAAKGTEYAGMSFIEMMNAGANLGDVFGMLQNHANETGVTMLDLWSSIEGGNAAQTIAKDLSVFKDDLSAMGTEADVVGDAFSIMSDTASFKIEKFKTSLKNMGIEAFSRVADTFSGALDGIQQVLEAILPSLEGLGGSFMTLVDAMASAVGDMLGLDEGMSTTEIIAEALKEAIDAVSGVFEFLSQHMDVVAPIVTGLVGAFVALKAAMAVQGIISGVTAAFSFLLSPVGLVVAAIAAAIAIGIALYQNWDTVKAWLVNTWNTIKTACSNVFDAIKNKISAIWNSIKTTTTNVWNNIKNAITHPIETAKNTVKSIIDRIKGFFNFSWSLPHLKLPHLSISGSFSIMPPSVPKFGIEWYKTGGVFDHPSVIGVGEAGREAVVPLSGSVMRPFAKAIAEELGGEGGTYTINVPLTIDGKEIARATATFTQDELNRLTRNSNRKLGVVL